VTAEEREAIELLAEEIHDVYLETCRKLGRPVSEHSARSYLDLDEDTKELDRAMVRWHMRLTAKLRYRLDAAENRVRALEREIKILVERAKP